jgi:light-regulated signal transduction histidine kinase (bacteriophytochrome)
VLGGLDVAIEESEAKITLRHLPEVVGDRTQLYQLLHNLLSNAIKFARPGEAPQITVSGETLEADEQGFRRWRISVEDQGIGIEKEYFDRIFQVFQRLYTRDEYPGNGIGLALCQKIAQRHGGTVQIHSEFGKGSRFDVILSERQPVFTQLEE